MNAFRKLLFWSHLTAGVLAGLVILLMSATGVALAFERQILQWTDRDVRTVNATSSERLSISTLLEAIEKSQQQKPASLTFRPEANASVEANFGRGSTAYVDPFTGAVVGEGAAAARSFFRVTEAWHRALGGSLRASPGRAIVGYSNLLFFFIVISGFYLWWPRKWTWRNVRPTLLFRGGLNGKARNWNWHNVTGIWCLVPLVIIVGSGVVMSFPWANNLLFRTFGSPAPAQGGRPGAAGGRGGEQAAGRGGFEPDGRGGGRGGKLAGNQAAGGRGARGVEAAGSGINGGGRTAADLDQIFKAAQTEQNWKSIAIALPVGRNGNVRVTIDKGDGGQPQSRFDRVYAADGSRVISEHRWTDDPLANRARSFVRFGHTGEMGGWLGQLIAALASLGGCFLVWTGIAMALSRLRSFLRRRRVSPHGAREPAVSVP